ncbi:zinc finger MYM-type protein 1-like [Heracleum sosnowskyi]|uniref:Zinc finger MYM-type protein 1-like n=1 Tax=Heracleum sosnowskyi TaxID=360622 RepID=A0AAD8IC34_9APIA|nr:zinc finger MYM-type protein 1-like [Heracleum sosnowskyi]
MKRSNTRDISSFFTKKPTTENASQVQTSEENPIPEINITRAPQPSAQGSSPSVTIPPPVVDIVNLSHDPGKRKKLIDFHPNERDLVRRMYIQRGPCQPVDHVFPKTLFGTKERWFNVKWFDSSWRPWLEYSVFKDAVFCFICYLFKAENTAGGDAFLQLTQVAIAKKNSDCGWLFVDVLAPLLNFVGGGGGSSKRKEFLREKQAVRVVEALSLGEIETGSGLNQERGLGRPCDTRWGSHFKTILNVLDLYPTILESLDAIAEVSDTIDSNKAQSITHLLMSFDFVFVAHLMVAIFGITNELNVALQKHDQDIVNAMSMVDITKTSLQKMRDEGWNLHMDKVTSFMVKYGVEVPNMEANYIVPGRRMYRGKSPRITNFHHFRVEVFLSVIDLQLQELENRFPELVLILPVATSSVERVFSGMIQVKAKLRSSMGDQMLNDCLITYQERDLFLNVKMSDIIDRYQNMKTRREQL